MKVIVVSILLLLSNEPTSSFITNRPLLGTKYTIIASTFPPYTIVTVNSTNQVTDVQGVSVEVMNWLSHYLGFQCVYSDRYVKTLENSSLARGGISFLLSAEADVILVPAVLTPERYRLIDLPFPWLLSAYSLMIPFPDTSANVAALWQPFEIKVWVALLVSAVVVVAMLHRISRFAELVADDAIDRPVGVASNRYFGHLPTSVEYVAGVFLAQGAVCFPKKLSIRLVAGVWCLVCFVTTYSYSTTLISHVASPNWHLLVQSIFDIPKKPDVRIVVDEKYFPDVLLSNARSGIFHELGDMLRRDPSLRCPQTAQCLDKVKSGPYAYIQGRTINEIYLGQDLKKHGHCSMTIARDDFLFFYASFPFRKGHLHRKLFDEGILILIETGFIRLWEHKFIRNMPERCLNLNRQRPQNPRLSFKHLSSAFVVLGVGYAISAAAFLAERLTKKAISIKTRSRDGC